MTKRYTLSKLNSYNLPVYVTARVNFSTGKTLTMLTGNKELALVFESEQEAFDYHNRNLSDHLNFCEMKIIKI